MTKTAKKIRQQYKDAYPDVRHIQPWTLDREYIIPTEIELRQMLETLGKSPSVQKMWKVMQDNPAQYDCDDFVRQLVALVRARRPLWPFGGATGTLKEAISVTTHDRATCITQSGMKDIEAMEIPFVVMDANPDNYEIFFARI
jgi:hypothetical protein